MAAVEISSMVARGRRRSLKALFQLPLFPRPPGYAQNPISTKGAPGTRISLPEDVLREITEQLSPNDILSVSLMSKRVQELLIPELYKTVHLRSSRSCDSGLRMLAKNPALCAHVQKLAVRPNYYLAWPMRDTQLSEEWVALMIVDIAKTLTHLRTFDWDGLEMPRDTLWLTLRKSCPELKELFSNVGFQPLNPDSELFKFNDLTNFSLSVRHGLGDTDIFPSHEELPTPLWDMLLNRCPNLTELTICSFSASHRLFAVKRVTEGRWPALSSLTLGAFGYNSDFTLATLPATPFASFLDAHPTLTYLRLAWNFKRWMSPDDTIDLPLPPTLDAFSGIAQQLPVGGCNSLTTLDLMCEPLYSARAPALRTVLRALPLLTSLELWVHVPEPRAGHEAFFRELWASVPGLEDLHFMCTTAFGKKPLTELARALRLLPKLHTFALTKGHRYADESMRRSALRIFNALAPSASVTANQNQDRTSSSKTITDAPMPRLTQVSVRWARAACRNHLKQEGTYERVFMPAPARPSEIRLRRRKGGGDRDGTTVEAWERGLRAVGGAFDRRYRFTLPLVPRQNDTNSDADGSED